MKYFWIIVLLVFGLKAVFAQQTIQKPTQLQTQSSLAISYYNAKEYEKAIPLLFEIFELSRNGIYFRYYIISLLELKRFEEAEKAVEKEIKKQKLPKPELYIHWGHILKVQKRTEEANEKYNLAFEKIPESKGHYLIAANTFMNWSEFELARDTYLKGREVLAPEKFNEELARIYSYLRDYDKMMEEYLDLVRIDEKQLSRVQSSLASTMRLDIDDGLRNKFRTQVLKRIQAEPNVTGYNRLLIWFFLQEKKFTSALRQSVALDRRTGQEGIQIIQLGNMALRNKKYSDAKNAFDYLIGKGDSNPFFAQAFSQNVHASYMYYITETSNNSGEGQNLAIQFKEALEFLGLGPSTLFLIQEYSHLLAFYLNRPDEAISVLEVGLKIPRLKPVEMGLLKTEMADIYVYINDPWEATLIYSQVIDANKKNSLGDEAKLKKAKLGYYIGNFSWAKAQLDVLKASTSKLTANDALDLSMLIGNNLNLDTTAIPLQMFARADLLFFRNKNSEAMTTLDSITEIYPYHTLIDDILYRKAKIEIEKQNFKIAAGYLEKIVSDFSYDLLADDAHFLLAEIYNYNLNDKEKARDLYKQMLVDHPGSVFVDESRKQYRELLEIYPDKEIEDKEDQFMNGINNNEFN